MSDAAERALAVRRRAGLLRLEDRGLLEVSGSDRERWLQGQISNDVRRASVGPGSCYAFLLSPIGRIVADLRVIGRPDAFWLELDRGALPAARERLEKYLIADDVELRDRSDSWFALGLEGPAAPAVLEALAGARLELEPEAVTTLDVAGVGMVVAAFGESGEDAYRLWVPRDAREKLEAALLRAGEPVGLVEGDEAVREILRVEAGTPRFGFELDEQVLPAETGWLERAVSFTKGCFTGQEVVARMQSRARFKHRLVGLVFEEGDPPERGTRLEVEGKAAGEVTSAVRSKAVGTIALAYLRRPHDEAGTTVRAGERSARVVELPFLRRGASLAGP